MTISFKVSDATKEKMIEYFQDKRRDKTPDYAIFQADEADSVITLYESGKAVFQGKSADIDANLWKEMEEHLSGSKVDVKNSEKKKKEETKVTKVYTDTAIGSDEVGTGDFFGPIVVTAAYVNKEDIPYLKELGVQDSKKLTDEKIMKIVPELIKKIEYESVILNNKDYNDRYSDEMNMNMIKAILHNQVLLKLTKKHPEVKTVIVDEFAKPKLYYNYLRGAKEIVSNITFVTKGESASLAVASASIISRYIFIKQFEAIGKEFDIILPKGAGPMVDDVAYNIAKEHGFDKLNDIAKMNFKNALKIKEKLT